MSVRSSLLIGVVALSLAGCPSDDEPTRDIFGDLGDPLPDATPSQLLTFERGRAIGLHRFTPAEGLGPHLNVTFCLSCHEKPVFGGSAGHYRDFLLVGQRLQDDSFVATSINGVQPQFLINEIARSPSDPNTNVRATRNPIPFFGVGVLATVSESEILSREDPDDSDGDGISGRANFDRGFLGRFGRKAQSASIESFIRGPLFNHLGITSNPLPDARRAELPVPSASSEEMMMRMLDRARQTAGSPDLLFQVGAPDEPTEDNDGVPDPELSENDLFDLIAFSMLTAAPRPDEPTAETELGEELCDSAGCTACHVAALKGPDGPVPAYTDLLLHDMGPELADNIPMGEATGAEFRTAPLWGISAVGPYLHDGRADTLDAAIRLHGGESEASRDAYVALGESDRAAVIAFLTSLGGASQHSEGLLAPSAPIPEVGSYGGPTVALDSTETSRFLAGRAVFDRDMGIARGLGPKFNGDSCRACHFEPVIGGAGPIGVDVVRHGIIDYQTGAFTAPNTGTTIAHRHSVAGDQRPAIDPATNFTEARQTPPLFGLGLIERIPDVTILAGADPSDSNGDGISGRVHILGDGRIGRLGWKADVPSLAEFARDAMSAELGITVPPDATKTFGALTDSDGVADPEISADELSDLVFFMQSLAPPPRNRVNPLVEDAGEVLFSSVGCAACHTPSMRTSDNVEVHLYSDLLLHDVQPAYRHGIVSGDASTREFRTSPLWGVSRTAPYMHDGRATTLRDAILAHHSEGTAAREAFLALSPADQGALLAFLRSL